MNMLKLEKYAKSLMVKTPEFGVRFIQVIAVYKKNTVDDANVRDTLTQINEWMEVENIDQSLGTQDMFTGASVTASHITKRTDYEEGKVLRTINEEDKNDSNSEFMNSHDD